tara:strand:+ start:356 stop:880 length:525 start_codon:yes stop_codon:yes gene_type:complete
MGRLKIMNYILCLLLVLLGVASRLIDHAPNFTPILSIAIMSGLYIKNRMIVLIPISIMLISDLFIGSYAIAFWVYTPILIICILAYFSKDKLSNILFYSFMGPILFFIISNFGVWAYGGYGFSIQGLITCYIAAIPFFKNTLISTFLFSGLIYMFYNAVKTIFEKNQSSKVLDY